MRTSYNGAVEASIGTLPFGDGYSVAGASTDPYSYALLDYDSETETEHAQFRQLYTATGRWMSPDPYMGSYDAANPQSMNRYAYVLDNPLAITDSLGLECDIDLGCSEPSPDPGSPCGFWCTIWNYLAGDGSPNPYGDVPFWGTGTGQVPIVAPQIQVGGGWGGAPNNGQEPPPACQAKILNATNNQFGTNYTNSNVTNTFNFSTGAGPGQGTLNLNISGSTAGVSTGYYPVHWWTYAIGFGPTLHVVGGDVLDSPQTLQFGPNQGTFHIDSGFPYNPIGAFAHWLLNMTKAGGYPKC